MTEIWVNHFWVLDENIKFSRIIILVFLKHWGAQRKEYIFLIINKFDFLVDFGLDGGNLVLSDDWNILSNAELISLSLIVSNEDKICSYFCPKNYNNLFCNSIKNHSYLGHFLRYMNGSVHFQHRISWAF